MQAGQDWCLHCGAGTPSSLDGGGGGWLSPVALLVATAALVLGAAAASYAAWGKSSSSPAALTTTVAQAPAPTPAAPAVTTTTTATTPSSPVKLPKTPVKPPKIPLTAVTPKTTATTSSSTSTSSTTTSETTTSTQTTTSETLPEPILLDTNAASTYDPAGYPAGEFGDPTLAIDGDTSTGWTAEVNPALAPKLGAGLLIDLKAPQRISSAELITASLGITVQVFGANVATPEGAEAGAEPTAPASISDPAWVKLSKTIVVKKHHVHIKLLHPGLPYRFIVLWIRFVPASDVGTAESPGRVSINEFELFPASE
jgi:hypothetical protein